MANRDPDKHPNLVVVDGAKPGTEASAMTDPSHRDYNPYWVTHINNRLANAGVSSNQVVVAWVKEVDAVPTATSPNTFPDQAQTLKGWLAELSRILKKRFPNIKLAYYSSRIYGGYALDDGSPEPYSYEGDVNETMAFLNQMLPFFDKYLKRSNGPAPPVK